MALPWQHQAPQRQPRTRPNVLPRLREQTSADCLPMAMCQWRRELAAVAREALRRGGREAAERVRGLGEGVPVPVLAGAVVAGQGPGEAEQERAVGPVAAGVVSPPAP